MGTICTLSPQGYSCCFNTSYSSYRDSKKCNSSWDTFYPTCCQYSSRAFIINTFRLSRPRSRGLVILGLIVRLILLLCLELAVACIQAYVFTILRSLYLNELRTVSFNKNMCK